VRLLAILTALLLLGAGSVLAAPSYLGPSGNIMTPDELTTPSPGFDIGYHRFVDLDFIGVTTDLDVVHGNFGLTPNIEVGLSWVDVRDNGGSDLAINGKWRWLDETATRPAVAVGTLDLAGNALDDDPTLYILFSKNLTPFTEDVIAGPVRPLRGTIGFGTGFYDGVFAALDWTLAPQLSVMLEYVRGGDVLDKNTLFNGGVRWAAGPGLRLDAALIDFDNLAFGVSWTRGF
jgi:hypothetical protein